MRLFFILSNTKILEIATNCSMFKLTGYLFFLACFFLFRINTFAQDTVFYKDVALLEPTKRKKAKYIEVKYYVKDTLITQKVRLVDRLNLEETKWLGNNPVGVWKKYDLDGNLELLRNFDTEINYNFKGLECHSANSKLLAKTQAIEKLLNYINSNLYYPDESQRNGGMGTIYIAFKIEKNGNISSQAIVRGIDPFIDLAVWNVLEKLPNVEPILVNGAPISSCWNFPIRFRLH